ncbi:hypothetical protein [Leisingera methylohalidivorans]|uniref:Uncharacterized protein n=1 Tax=Leisingera methylohalidivorans DSM 14336 TaxID=999552 RepID=V9W1X0_9RHOB|nr:hypothetical protein [Leisingera methylohalidivorans]AHD03655.1 hypothetical protein METH_22765 [Leisingera methylohalidivorans DSM 14336]
MTILSDEEFEAQAFRELEAAKKAVFEREKASVTRFQYPDSSTVFQRLRAWWYVRQHRAGAYKEKALAVPSKASVWHWATTKYL